MAAKFDVTETPFAGFGAGQFELHLIHVDPDNLAIRAHDAGELERYVSAAAA
jgi:hypothetical protein